MEHTIYTRFHEIAISQPNALAITTSQGQLTYGQLDTLTKQIEGLFPDDLPPTGDAAGLCAIILDHGPLMIAAILAVLRSGRAYIPIEHSIPVERKRFMLEESQAEFVITDRDEDLTSPGKASIPALLLNDDTRLPEPTQKEPRGEASSLAYMLYTSGTTGRPKGIMVEQRNVLNYAYAFYREMGIAKGDIMLQYSVNTFDIFVEEVFSTLLNGAALAIPDVATRADIDKLLDFVEEQGVSIISGFPYLLQDIDRTGRLPQRLRLLVSGGDVLRASYIQNIKDKVLIYNTYGPSETTVCATYQRCDNIPPLEDGTYPIGHPVYGVDVKVLDDNLDPVKPGQQGEICIMGRGVSRGYLGHRPEQANFVTLADGTRLYRSGDLGYWLADGTLAFVRRKDKQVMIWGKRVECSEVENVLCECSEVARAAVRAVTDAMGINHLVAYIVPSGKGRFSAAAIRKKISALLSDFMLPEYMVRLAALPLTPNGKVDDLKLAAIPVKTKK